jgi:DnaJ-class molecular chaperone
VLEVAFDSTEETVRKSYRKLAREWHPDKNPEKGAREKFQKIAKAYEVLSTEVERKKYDQLMSHPEVWIFLMRPPPAMDQPVHF